MLSEQSRYSRLAHITKIINTKLDLKEVLQHVTEAISDEIFQCNAVGIYLPQPDGTFRGFVGKTNFMDGINIEDEVVDPDKDSLVKEMIDSKKTIYIPDVEKDTRPARRNIEAFNIKSLLALPIFTEKELYGLVFLFDSGQAMNLTPDQIQSIEAYVNMAAVAIQNANQLKEMESLLMEKQLLLDVTRDLSMCSTLQDCLDTCFSYLNKILKSQYTTAYLLDPIDKKTIITTKLYEACNWTATDWRESLNSDSLFKHVLTSKKTLYLPDVYQDERVDHELCRQYGVKALLLIPFVSMGEVLGIIAVVDLDGSRPLNPSKIQLAQSIIDATAPTFSNLQTLDQLENRVKRRTRELATANEKVSSVMEIITDDFFILDKNWRFTYFNKHLLFQNRFPGKDLLNMNIWEVIPEAVESILYKQFHRVMEARKPVRFEVQVPENDYWQEVAVYPFEEGICCLFKDVTEKKKYEQELKRLSSLDLIGQMAAGISHEIRNPMTTVRGFLQLIQKEKEFEKYHNYFHLMIEELDRANSIITEFLSMGNTRTSDLQMLNLNSIIQDMSPLIKVDAFSQNKCVEYDLQESIPDLSLNRNEIRQLIINLYRNGLEEMETGKVLTIRTYEEKDGSVVLAVKDQGKGIKPEVLDKLGTPFFTTKDNGTGLGLGVCYAIAARHHAKIDIETGPDGTTFLCTFFG